VGKKYKTAVLNTTLATAALILLPASVQAVEVTVSGQVNRLIMNVDNGSENGVVHADNSVSGTRWRFAGEGELDNGMTAGLLYEIQLQSNPSDKITAGGLDSDGDVGNLGGGDNFSNRQANVWMKGNFGKVTIGQGSGAADGSAEVDDSGTTVIQYSGSSNDLLGSMEFGGTDVKVKSVRSSFDGLGRNDNIRYDVAIGDLGLAASLGNGDKFEASAIFKMENLKFKVGFWDEQDSDDGIPGSADGIAGSAVSASWGGDAGLNLSGAYGSDDRDGDPSNLYLKVGFKMGDNAFGVDWSETTDLGPGDADSISVAWVGSMMQGVEIYASYRIESLDGVAGADDIDALVGGMRVKF
jgi:predicted porin